MIDRKAPNRKRPRGKDNEVNELSKPTEEEPVSKSILNTNFHSQLPPYLSEVFSDLYAQDGLAVIGRGLGWLRLLAALVRFYSDSESGYGFLLSDSCSLKNLKERKPPLVIVLNLRENESRILLSTLTSWGTPLDQLPTLITNESGQAYDRSVLYARGGIFIITSRILIVDLLTGTVRAHDIAGILVAHGEKVHEASTEAFILRIFRGQKHFIQSLSENDTGHTMSSPGFIKAITDDPSTLVQGFPKVEKILKSLQVPNIYLYPRFHSSVAEDLERYPPLVEELHQPLSEKMKQIQSALAAAVRACLRDLRSRCPLVDFSALFHGDDDNNMRRKKKKVGDIEYDNHGAKNKHDWEIDIKKIVSTNFDLIISRQLQADWHRLTPDVKQRISDLTTLRKLFYQLIHSDCIWFWKMLEGIKARNIGNSGWILDAVGERLFQLARERVYRVEHSRKSMSCADGDSVAKLIPILEENPKERLVLQVLTVIQMRCKLKEPKFRNEETDRVLIMVKDGFTHHSVRSFLLEGGKRSISRKWLKYLEVINEKSRAMLRSVGGGVDAISQEQRLLVEEEGRLNMFLKESIDRQPQEQNLLLAKPDGSDWRKRNQKIIQESRRCGVDADTFRDQETVKWDVTSSSIDLNFDCVDLPNNDTEPCSVSNHSYSDDDDDDDDEEELAYKVTPIKGLTLVIRTYEKLDDGEGELLLRDIRPSYVILYDIDAGFIRALEMYSNSIMTSSPTLSLNEASRLQVFFLLYEASAEEASFLQTLDREKKAFDRLIDHKTRMPHVPNTFNSFDAQEIQQAGAAICGTYASGTLPLSMDTRTGGRHGISKERRDIAVDVREFRSSLPSILHQGGMRIAPVTLTVGDFILSNVHCIERKSISDLFGSFASGRLYVQVEAMTKYYKCPCLLIEFDPEKTFELQSKHDLGGDIRIDSICSKLTLLAMHFPRLSYLWSRSPHETLKLFKKLKRNHQEVDVDKATQIGTNDSLDELLLQSDGYEEEDYNENFNETGRRMLLRLPGVNATNARKIMGECDSIAELADLSRDELKRIVGPVVGQKLFTFFRQRFTA